MSNFLKRTKRASEELAYDEMHGISQHKYPSFKDAWNDYVKTDEYKKSEETMLKMGMVNPYVNNILFLTFSAGWSAAT